MRTDAPLADDKGGEEDGAEVRQIKSICGTFSSMIQVRETKSTEASGETTPPLAEGIIMENEDSDQTPED